MSRSTRPPRAPAACTSSSHRRTPPDRGRVAQLLQSLRLDLSDPLGGEPEDGADLAQRLRGPAESVMAPEQRALALVEPPREILHLHLVEHVLVLVLRLRIRDHVPERG